VKNGTKVRKKQKQKIFTGFILLFFEGNETFNARNELDKVVIVGGSKIARVRRWSPQPAEANGGVREQSLRR